MVVLPWMYPIWFYRLEPTGSKETPAPLLPLRPTPHCVISMLPFWLTVTTPFKGL